MKRVLFTLGLTVALFFGLLAYAASGAAGLRPCPVPKFGCLDVYNPVVCNGGVVFSNACYAAQACATGCVTLGVLEQ